MPSDDKHKSLSDKLYGDFTPAQVPRASDGGILPGFAMTTLGPAARPAPTEENFVCLRGPCRHFWHLVGTAGEGNPEGTWEAIGIPAPKEHYLTCLVHQGTETQLSFDEPVFECNRWDPMHPSELAEREERRELYEIRRRKAAEEPKEQVPEDIDDDGGTDDEGTIEG